MENRKFFEAPKTDANKVHKDIAVEFLSLVGSGKPKDGLLFFDPECKTHNPYTAGGMERINRCNDCSAKTSR